VAPCGSDGRTLVNAPQHIAADQRQQPTFGELVRAFLFVGFLSFGGAAGQIAMMHKLIVEEKRWLDETRYLHALNYCMLLPGPEAQQLATYIGWLTHGVKGGLVAGLLFVLPGAILMLGLSLLYFYGTGLSAVDGLFFGIKAAVLAIVVHALQKIAKRGLKTRPLYALAVVAFLAILFLDLPFPLIIIGAGVLGAILAHVAPAAIGVKTDAAPAAPVPPGRVRGAFIAAFWCLIAWWLPVGLAVLALGGGHVLVEIGLFFSKLAVITFGGAYAVLAYLAQAGVDMGWVSAREMIDGLGLAETTPGPTILVNQFVAFLGALRAADPLGPLAAAVLGSAMATWVTFAPSFLWIFAGAPFVETLRRNRALAGALMGITAAVVGVIGYITLWFALHVLFGEVTEGHWGVLRTISVTWSSLDWRAAALTAIAFGLMFGLHRGILTTVGILAVLGLALKLSGL
jgi:chromate transporter